MLTWLKAPKSFLESRMNISFLLIKPENPANVGATARAMKTMGHHDLRLIAPCDYLNERGRALAHASEDLLESAKVYETFEEATAGMDLVIATTARHRRLKFDYIDSSKIMEKISSKGALVKNVCFVFGGERDGLATEFLRKADLITTIPTATKFPSLNLSQSVMIFSYLAKSELAVVQTDDWRINENELKESDMSSLKASVLEVIDDLGMKDATTLKRQATHAISKLGYDDLYLVHNLRKRIAARLASLKALVKE